MFQQLRRIFSRKSLRSSKSASYDRYVLVLSGGGTRGFYTLWVLKALEEMGLKEKVDAIYGVSIWAIFWCYRAAGWTAQEIFNHAKELSLFSSNWINVFPKQYLLKTHPLQEYFKADLPARLEDLRIKTYIGATDIYTAQLKLFSKGELIPPLLWSMALPGIFPSVKHQKFLLNDGGIIDNFPTTFAQKQYPNHKIIGVVLNKFEAYQEPKNLITTLITTFEVMMWKDLLEKLEQISIAFYEKIDCSVLELRKSKRKDAFEQGYRSGMKKFKKL